MFLPLFLRANHRFWVPLYYVWAAKRKRLALHLCRTKAINMVTEPAPTFIPPPMGKNEEDVHSARGISLSYSLLWSHENGGFLVVCKHSLITLYIYRSLLAISEIVVLHPVAENSSQPNPSYSWLSVTIVPSLEEYQVCKGGSRQKIGIQKVAISMVVHYT